MGDQRSSIFGDDGALDVQSFKPTPIARPEPAVAEQAAAKTGFKSREPKKATEPKVVSLPVAVPVRQQRRHRTGRNAQLNLKATPETIASFIAIADAQGWVLGEALEKAVGLLQKQYGKGQ